MTRSSQRASRVSLFVIASLATLFAQAASPANQNIYVFDGSGLVANDSCALTGAQALAPSALRDLNLSVKIAKFAPIQNEDGSPLSLNESVWTAGTSVATARCENVNGDLYSVHVAQPTGSLEVLVAADKAAAFVNLVTEFASLSATTNTIALKTMAVEVIDGSPEDVICTSSSSLNVRDATLKKVLFAAPRLENVKKTQGWETAGKATTISGKSYTFIPVQFPKRANTNGWIAKDFVKNRSECGVTAPVVPTNTGAYGFPTIKRPSISYLSGMRAFGASRGGGKRAHAANDLYRIKNEAVVAASAGTVIRDLYSFYEGTYALEVKQTDGRVVRYGEVTGTRAANIKAGAAIKMGQTIGYVGKVNSGCCTPMLHFEMYSGKATGPLTTSGTKYIRRSDLVNPSQDLRAWEMKSFGASY